MNVTEEMVLLVIKQRHELLKEYVNSEFNNFVFISSVEKYLNKIKPLADEMCLLLKEYKKQQAEHKDEVE